MSSKDAVAVTENADQERKLVPKLRFPEFEHSGGWGFKPLKALAKRRSERNAGEQIVRVLTNSAEYGVVDQKDYFEKDIATKGNLETYFVVAEGDYVYNPRISSLAPVGPIGKNKIGTGVMSPLYTVFRFNNEANDFYEHYFRSTHWHDYLRLASNTGARHDRMAISNDDFNEMPMPVPDPAEQQRIAECLSSLDVVIGAATAKLAALKDHKRSLLQRLFPAEGEKIPRLRFPEFKDAGEWVRESLGSVGKLVTGLTYSPSDVRESGLLVLRSSNIRDGQIDFADCVYVDPDIRRANKVHPDDILICVRNGSTSLIGKNALIPEKMPLCTHGAFMTIFRSPSAKFVFQLFQTSAYQRQVAADLGATINSINGTQLLRYQFCFPSPPEQLKIVELLSSIDRLIIAEADRLAALRDHKTGLRQQLFTSPNEASA